MLQSEFENLYGKRIAPEEYAKIERIYLASPQEWDKKMFVATYKNLSGNALQLINSLLDENDRLTIKKQNAEHDLEMANETIKEYKGKFDVAINTNKELAAERDQLKEEKAKLALALIEEGKETIAELIIGRAEVIGLKCKNNIPLDDIDREFIADTFKI